jgi:hypothetical protein
MLTTEEPVAIHEPGSRTFNTTEVRPWKQPSHSASKNILFARPFDAAPGLAVGLNSLDVDRKGGLRVNAYADQVSRSGFRIHIDSWEDTVLYSAGCTWLEVAPNNTDIQIGRFNTMEVNPWGGPQPVTSRRIHFGRAFSAPPRVVVWLNSLDMNSTKNWRVAASATQITPSGFSLSITTWGDSLLYSAGVSWIAYPADKPSMASGTFNTLDVRPWDQPRPGTSGQVGFAGAHFSSSPRVLLGLNSIDADCAYNLRIRLAADRICSTGMNWHIDSWADTRLYSAGASYLALE